MQKYRVWIAYFFHHYIDGIIHPFVFISLVVFFSFLFRPVQNSLRDTGTIGKEQAIYERAPEMLHE